MSPNKTIFDGGTKFRRQKVGDQEKFNNNIKKQFILFTQDKTSNTKLDEMREEQSSGSIIPDQMRLYVHIQKCIVNCLVIFNQ